VEEAAVDSISDKVLANEEIDFTALFALFENKKTSTKTKKIIPLEIEMDFID